MIIDLTRLKSGIDEYIQIDISYSFNKDELVGTDILEMNDVKIIGEITRNNMSGFNIHLTIAGTMVLPCSVTLKPVNHQFNITINDDLLEILKEIDENMKKIENSLDIFPIVWENILMEIPMRVVSNSVADIKLEGEGWKFITNDNE